MSKYDKELDTRTPEYEKAVDEKRSKRERDGREEANRDHESDGGEERQEPQRRPQRRDSASPR